MNKKLYRIFLYSLQTLVIILVILAIADLTLKTYYKPCYVINFFGPSGINNFINYYSSTLKIITGGLAGFTLLFTITRIKQTDKQLKLMRKNRRMSYQPDLYIGQEEVSSISRGANNGEYSDKLVFTSTGMFNEEPFVKVYNIGLAVAKKVECEFVYDTDEAIKKVKAIEENNIFELFITNESSFNISGRGFNEHFDLIRDFCVQDVNFILPVSKDNTYFKLYLPDTYCALFVYNNCALASNGLLSFRDNNFPNLFLTMEYHDIDNKKYKKCLSIQFLRTSFDTHFQNKALRDYENKYILQFEEVDASTIPKKPIIVDKNIKRYLKIS